MLFTTARLSFRQPSTYASRYLHHWLKGKMAENVQVPVNKTAHAFDKGRLESMLSTRFFYAPAFEIYRGEYAIVRVSAVHIPSFFVRRAEKRCVLGLNPFCGRCCWALRLWPAWFLSPSQYPRGMAETFHHRRAHARARYNNPDTCYRLRDLRPCRQIC